MKISGENGLATGQQEKAQKSQDDSNMSKKDFLELLTTQLQNQDPLDPTKNKDFVEQLARMTSLERLGNVQKSVEGMAMAQSANTSAQVVSFIGKSVQVPSSSVEVQSGQPQQDFGVKLKGNAEDVKVKIKDASGGVVKTIDKGSLSKGEHSLHWDGTNDDGVPVSDGEYSLEVVAKDGEGESVNASTFSFRKVDGVTFNDGSPMLMYGDGKTAKLGEVQEVRE